MRTDHPDESFDSVRADVVAARDGTERAPQRRQFSNWKDAVDHAWKLTKSGAISLGEFVNIVVNVHKDQGGK